MKKKFSFFRDLQINILLFVLIKYIYYNRNLLSMFSFKNWLRLSLRSYLIIIGVNKELDTSIFHSFVEIDFNSIL